MFYRVNATTDSQSADTTRTDTDSVLLDLESEVNQEDVERETDDPLEFLEGIGLEKSHFPSLRAAKVRQ